MTYIGRQLRANSEKEEWGYLPSASLWEVHGQDQLKIKHEMIWDSNNVSWWVNQLIKKKKIKCGVWQGCVLAPDLFSLYSEMIWEA